MRIDNALNVLFQRQLSSREQLLNEMLRVKMTQKKLKENFDKTANIQRDREVLFQLMKKTTEDHLGFFPTDRDDFLEIFEALKDIDLIDFTIEIYKNDRIGTVISPQYLTEYISERIQRLCPQKVLITEAEKHLSGLGDLIKRFPNIKITLTTHLKPMHILLQLAFGEYEHVKIRFESIYMPCLENEKYDYVYSLPIFSNRPEGTSQTFLTRDSDGIAFENMLNHLDENSTLDIIVPAKITFASLGYEKLRSYITENFYVENMYLLPEGTFRPATAIKTYLFSVTSLPKEQVNIGTFELQEEKVNIRDKQTISIKDFLSHKDWRIELLLANDNENIRCFRDSDLPKVKLKNVAEVFRGKSILKKDLGPGNVAVLNISNIKDGEIDYHDLDTIDEEEHKIKRYELSSGDVVLSCRGTSIKSAVFEAQDKTIIASANLVVIRPKEKVKGEFIKIFLESPVGQAMIQSFQRGTILMNINYADIMEMEIPFLPIYEQQKMIETYCQEFKTYKEAINLAESRWSNIKMNIYNNLL